MKSVTKFMSILSLALVVGAVASPARALEYEYDYPGQRQIDAREVTPYHSMNNYVPMAAPMPAPHIDEVVHFDTKSDKLAPSETVKVKHVAMMMKSPAFADKHVVVNGYTDSVGKDASNQHLSYHRAVDVMHQLIADGVPAGKLSAQGFGKSNPVATNSTAEGRAANRRVTFTVICPPMM